VTEPFPSAWRPEDGAPPAPAGVRVLLVEDNPGDARLVRVHLSQVPGAACTLAAAASLKEAVGALARGDVDVVLADLGLPDSQGLDTASRLARAAPSVPVVVLTGLDDEELGRQALLRGAQDYLVKGKVDGASLWRAVRHARERAHAARTVREALHHALASQATLMRVLERNADGIVVADAGGTVRYANAAAATIFGGREAPLAGSRFPHPMVPGSITEFVVRGDDGRAFATVEMRVVDVDWSGTPALLASLRDLTERRAAEAAERRMSEELGRAQRMEAVGRLAGGIAHDFNNLLTVVQGAAQLAASRMDPGDAGEERDADRRDADVRRHLGVIESSAQRAASLTRQLLAVSRRQVQAPRIVDVHEVLAEAEPLLASTLGEAVVLRVQALAKDARVRADPQGLREMLVNLALRARDTMRAGGTWALRTDAVDLDMDWCQQRVGLAPGRYLRISFSDTGAGLDGRAARHVFEPFADTATGGAVGLGLASAYGLARQAGGTIELERGASGQGATFHVYLPRVREGDVEEPQAPAAAPARPVGASPRILLVEDMPELREVAREALQRAGYQVVEASNGAEALEARREADGEIDLVVTDVMMPDLNGPDLVARVRAEDPAAKVLFMSGYAADDLVHLGLLASGAPCLPKPFTTRQLLARVADALGTPSGHERAPSAV
jgi:two-component system cell cycle sensor histidine kinase/response regulator CckA